MKYNRLHINHFGKLQNRTLEFSDGINVIYGPNESGKSTLHAFLESMLFGMERGRGKAASHDIYSRYYPEEGSSTYGGVLEFTQNDTLYAIYRNFKKDPKGYTLMDETHNRQLNITDTEYYQFLNQMTLPLYRNTISLGQLQAATSKEFPQQLRNHIVNLRTSGSAALDITQAKESLKKERRRWEQLYSKEAEQQLQNLELQKSQILEEQAQMISSQELPEWEQEKSRLQNQIETEKAKRTGLLAEIRIQESVLNAPQEENWDPVLEDAQKCQRLLDRREKLKERYPEPLPGNAGHFFPVLTLCTFFLSILSIIFGLFSMITRGGLASLALIILGILLFFLFHVSKKRAKAQLAFRYVDRDLLDLCQKVLPEPPNHISPEILQDLIDMLNSRRSGRALLNELHKEERSITEHILKLQEELDRLMIQLDAKKQEMWQKTQLDERIRELELQIEELEPLLERNKECSEEIAAIDLAIQTINELSVTAFDSFGSYLQAKASELISQITGGCYDRLLIDDELHITLEHNHTPVELKSLSCSTLDQVYLSLRIACIDFFWPDDVVPILLDESFAMYDSDRIRETLSWLSEFYPGQVFLFTCQHREETIMQEAHIAYQTISL
ncbi:MAG: AAA family ATPase [Clostridiales bacterium]|nr:AAA family ATPase [Clostridiales bacterium]